MFANGRSMPIQEKLSTGTVWPLATTFERPRNAASVPSVVISAFTSSTVTRKPLITPTPSAARIAIPIENPSPWLTAK